MGIEDRDYYKERLRQREQQERQERQQLEHTRTRFAAYDRQPRAAFQAGERSLLGMVLVWLLVLGLAYGGMKFYQRVKQPAPIQPGAWSIPRAADGHFYVQGSVNGVQTIFLVDTGASLVTISENWPAQPISTAAYPPLQHHQRPGTRPRTGGCCRFPLARLPWLRGWVLVCACPTALPNPCWASLFCRALMC